MNKSSYTTATIAELPTASSYHEQQRQNRLALIEAIERREGNPYGYDLDAMSTLQLEAILEYGSPHAFSTTEYTDDRNFISGTKGRAHKGCDPLPDDNFRDYHDGQVVKSILGYRSYKRHLMSSYRETPKEAKERKIRELFALVDDKYRKIIDYILENDIEKLVEITMNRYEQTIRRYLAGMLRIRGPVVGHVLTIEEACQAIGLQDTSQYLKHAQELMDADLYHQETILDSMDAVIEQATNVIYDLQNHSELISAELGEKMRQELSHVANYLREKINGLRSNKVYPLVIVLIRRHLANSIIDVFTPLVKRPDYDGKLLLTAKQAAKRLFEEDPRLRTMAFAASLHNEGKVKTENTQQKKQSESTQIDLIQEVSQESVLVDDLSDQKTQADISSILYDPKSYYLIRFRLHNEIYAYVVGTTTSITESIDLLKNYLTKGVIPDLDIYYESLPILHNRRDEPDLIEARTITESERIRSWQYICNEFLMAMPGELSRSHLVFSAKHQSVLLSHVSEQHLLNTSRSVRTQKYRLQKGVVSIPDGLQLHVLESGADIFAFEVQINSLLQGSDDMIIIGDLREIVKPYVSSLLDVDQDTALREYSKFLLRTHRQGLHKFELSEKLRDYKLKWQADRELYASDNQEELHYRHLPRIPPPVVELLVRWIHHPRIRVASSMSPALTRTSSGIEYRPEYISKNISKEQMVGLDHIMIELAQSTISYPMLISPQVNNVENLRKDPVDTQKIGYLIWSEF